MPTTYGYTRVSTDEQTVALQLDALRAVGVPAEKVYSDEGVSGTVAARERPAFARVLAAMRPGDTLAVYALSRVGRSTLDVLETLRVLGERGVTFRSLTEGFDTSTPMGRAMSGMLAVFAQLDRELIVERVKAGIAAAQSRGVHTGRPASVSAERRAAVLDALEAGLSVAEVARLVGVSESTVRRLRG